MIAAISGGTAGTAMPTGVVFTADIGRENQVRVETGVATLYKESAIQCKYSSLPPSTEIEMHSGNAYECVLRIAACT